MWRASRGACSGLHHLSADSPVWGRAPSHSSQSPGRTFLISHSISTSGPIDFTPVQVLLIFFHINKRASNETPYSSARLSGPLFIPLTLPFLTSQLNNSQCCLSVFRVMACPSSTSPTQSLLPSHPPQAGIYTVGSPGFPEDPKQPGLCAVFAVSGRPLSPIWQLKLSSSGASFEAGSCIPHLPAQSLAHSLLGAGRNCVTHQLLISSTRLISLRKESVLFIFLSSAPRLVHVI